MAGSAAKRYARAIFDLAKEEGQLEAWSQRLAAVREVLANPDARTVLTNPTISVQRRQVVASALLDDRVGPEGVNLARLLVGANRLDDVHTIAEEYSRLVDEDVGRIRATAITAVPLSRADADKLGTELAQKFGHEVRLDTTVDPAILGGLVLRIGDRVIDASVAARLQQLRQRLAGV